MNKHPMKAHWEIYPDGQDGYYKGRLIINGKTILITQEANDKEAIRKIIARAKSVAHPAYVHEIE